ncbi:MAG: hypothetical protein L0241_19895, partial [Planctomycetia bacterium]|nr:hypothetical protein [Planctomycetia bacterium]
MNRVLSCPGCGFRGMLPAVVSQLQSIMCPSCRTVVPLNQIEQSAALIPDASVPIRVDDSFLGKRAVVPEAQAPLELPASTPEIVLPQAPLELPGNSTRVHQSDTVRVPPQQSPAESPIKQPAVIQQPAPAIQATPEANPYTGEYMKDDAARFAKYVAARLADIQKKRQELTTAESNFETLYMTRKQELHQQQNTLTERVNKLNELEADIAAREAALAAREAALTVREAEVVTRESRVSRVDIRAADIDRRTAELRAAID